MPYVDRLTDITQAQAAASRWEGAEPEDRHVVRRYAYNGPLKTLFVELSDGRQKVIRDVEFVEWIKFQASPRRSEMLQNVMRGSDADDRFRAERRIDVALEAGDHAFQPRLPGDGLRRVSNSDELLRMALYQVEWFDVTSTNVKRIAYDEASQTIFVEFLDGLMYFYPDQSPGLWHSFFVASSKGTWVHDFLRGAYGRRAPMIKMSDLDKEPYGRL